MKHRDIKQFVLNKLKEKGKCSVHGLGTFTIKPARKGMTHTKYGTLPNKYDKRIVFKASGSIKEKINE